MSHSDDGAAGGCACSAGVNGGSHDGSGEPSCTHCRKSDTSSSYAYTSLSFDSIPLTDSEKLRRIVISSIKGFAIGAGLKGGLALFSILARLGRKEALTSLRWNSSNTKFSVILRFVIAFVSFFYTIVVYFGWFGCSGRRVCLQIVKQL